MNSCFLSQEDAYILPGACFKEISYKPKCHFLIKGIIIIMIYRYFMTNQYSNYNLNKPLVVTNKIVIPSYKIKHYHILLEGITYWGSLFNLLLKDCCSYVILNKLHFNNKLLVKLFVSLHPWLFSTRILISKSYVYTIYCSLMTIYTDIATQSFQDYCLFSNTTETHIQKVNKKLSPLNI